VAQIEARLKMANGVRYTPTFAMPSEYEQQAMEARRRRRMAEMLAAQAYQPQEGGVAPIPTAAPLVQGLQAFLAARQERKAEEAAEKASQTESEYAKRLAGRLAGGYEYKPTAEDAETLKQREGEAPEAYRERMRTAQFTSPTFDEMLARTPEQTTLEQITPTARYKRSPEEALAMAETDVGMAAMKNRPILAARLAQLLEKPETKAPTTVGGMMWDAKQQKFVEIPGYSAQQGAIASAKRPDVVITGDKNEPLVSVKGPDGNPILVPRSQAVGMMPYSAKQEAADVERVRSLADKSASTQTALDNIAELLVDPGRKAGTGASAFLGNIPGTAARSFQARLETFKAQTFIPMVSALKGMGALSDAEGKKLSAAVGALDPSMKEEDFESELRKVAKTLYNKAKVAGLDVVMPEGLGDSTAAPSRSKW
jgi:hypothetical protein